MGVHQDPEVYKHLDSYATDISQVLGDVGLHQAAMVMATLYVVLHIMKHMEGMGTQTMTLIVLDFMVPTEFLAITGNHNTFPILVTIRFPLYKIHFLTCSKSHFV